MTKKLTTTGVMLALSTVLSLIRLFDAPYGGSVTLASMLPIITISLLYGTKWGALSGIVFSCLTMITGGFPAPPVLHIGSYLLVTLLDYVLPFGFLGAAHLFYVLFGRTHAAIPASAAVVIFFRFLCHFASGIFIWSVYAWEGFGAAAYSFLYNGSYMLFELLITVALSAVLSAFIQKKINGE